MIEFRWMQNKKKKEKENQKIKRKQSKKQQINQWKKHKLIFFYFNSNQLVFPFQEECFNPPFPLFVTRRVMTQSTLFPRHTFQIRLCQLQPPPNCAFVYLKIHHLNGPPTLHRMTGPPTLKPSLMNQKFHSSGLPHHNEYNEYTIEYRPKKQNKQKRKNRVSEAVVVLGQKTKNINWFFLTYVYLV